MCIPKSGGVANEKPIEILGWNEWKREPKYQILQDKFTHKLLNGGGDIFKEIKKFRGQSTTISNCIDGEVGAQNIAVHFQEIYENLYFQHTLGEDFDKVQQNIQERVHHVLRWYI